ncbi:Hypothetical_protein [Hexamita inflata]|uniref:Hypothetical_protein n=1 Tax=Hexamita inflata TaxID=28002 RepID=A0ABP1KFE0_9EUKA
MFYSLNYRNTQSVIYIINYIHYNYIHLQQFKIYHCESRIFSWTGIQKNKNNIQFWTRNNYFLNYYTVLYNFETVVIQLYIQQVAQILSFTRYATPATAAETAASFMKQQHLHFLCCFYQSVPVSPAFTRFNLLIYCKQIESLKQTLTDDSFLHT